MNSLDIRLFGGVYVSLNGRGIGSFQTRWASGLLAYLALKKGKLLHRDVLASLFWPEESDQRARKSLRNALWRVRSKIEPTGVPPGSFLWVKGKTVGLAADGSVRLDVAEFDCRVSAARSPELEQSGLESLEESIRLYRGDFLDGHDYPWCVHERERLRLALLSVLERLLTYHFHRGEWSLALQRGRALLSHDPFREHVHRCLMVCHYSMGDRPLAIRQYRECVQILQEEMGLAPMEATRRLCQEIRRDSLRLPHPRAYAPPGSQDSLGPEMTEALARAEEALSDLRRLTAAGRSLCLEVGSKSPLRDVSLIRWDSAAYELPSGGQSG